MAKKASAMTEKKKAMEKKRKSTPVGEGGRFEIVKKEAAMSGAKEPGAVAAAIGRKKYGKAAFQKMAAAGKKKG